MPGCHRCDAVSVRRRGCGAGSDTAPGFQGGSHFGAPVLKYTVLTGQGALMFGGRGGWNLTPSLMLGGGAYGTLSEVDAREGAVPDASGPLDVKFESFGFDLEYAVHPAAPTHLTLTTFMGGGAARYAKDKSNEQEGETDFMLLLEPAVGVERSVTPLVPPEARGVVPPSQRG